MQFKTCLFCKRSMDQFCYSIYDPGNQPYLNIMQLFGDVEENLRHGRCICHECLYLIRWIYFMKKILADALLDEDTGEYDKVIPAFNIFKVKMSQPIFILAGESENEEEDIENDLQAHPENGRIRNHSNNNWLPSKQAKNHENHNCSSNPKEEHSTTNKHQYCCSMNVCEHKCDTFDELKAHYKLHHLIEQNDLTIETYEKQLNEWSKVNLRMQNSRRKKFRCLLMQCRRAFKTVESLSEHKVKDHDQMAMFWCVECYNLKFTSREDLNQHQQSFHAKNNITERANEYPCKYCDKYFLEKSLLSTHQLKYHNQFLDQSESTKRTILKRQTCKTEKVSLEGLKDLQQGMCLFKMRQQKDIVTRQRRQQDILFKCMQSKYPNFNPARVGLGTSIQEQKLLGEQGKEKEKEKILISLPPRKRRLYQVANDLVQVAKTAQVNVVSTIPTVSTIPAASTISAVPTISVVPTIVSTAVSTAKETAAVESLPSKVVVTQNELITVNISEKTEEKVEKSDFKEPIISDIPIENLVKCANTPPLDITHLETIEIVQPVEKPPILENIPETSLEETQMVVKVETSVNKSDIKVVPLKTYNCRKRKKPAGVKTLKKKCIEKQEVDPLQNIQNTPNFPESEENTTKPPDVNLLPGISQPVISQIEEKDNDNCLGRITMKISLKAIRESKRKKKLKGKKKSKIEVSLPTQLKTENAENKLVNGTLEESSVSQPSVYYSQTSISESENETRNEIILNKDEINMIIFGETLNGNVTVVNEQIIDCDQVTSTNPQIVLPDAAVAPLTLQGAKKKTKAKTRFSKKRKVKKQNPKTIGTPLVTENVNIENCDGLIGDIQMEVEDTVEGQIANIQLKDHLYAISAFNAFKNSK